MAEGAIPDSLQAAKDLSKVPGFGLGPLLVDPPARRIGVGERSEMLEPRVMRVLVALGAAPGKVLSRDDLIEQCWDGTIVGDNAIDRVISRLRHVLEDLGGSAVRLETITKVGFRVVCESSGPEADAVPGPPAGGTLSAWPPKLIRRVALGGLAVAAAGASLGFAVWNRAARHGPDPRALDLYRRGQFLLKTDEIGTVRQAMDFYKQAVSIDPDFADAWGAMAVGYVQNLNGQGPRALAIGFVRSLDGPGPRARVVAPGLSRSAAERALALDPDQPDAQLALALPDPHFRRWLEHEKRLRDIVRRHPDYWYGHAQLGILLQDVGRTEEAVERYRRTLEIDPMLPSYWARLAVALHHAGRDQESDITFDEAFARWPANIYLRVSRVSLFMASKRYAEAAALLRDRRDRPDGTPEKVTERGVQIADALASNSGFERQIDLLRGLLAQDQGSDLPSTAMVLLWFGAVSLALDALEAAYLGGEVDGRRIPPPDASDQRPTALLFSPTVLHFRDNPRYASLLERIGLDDYWRKSGSRPDFRKG